MADEDDDAEFAPDPDAPAPVPDAAMRCARAMVQGALDTDATIGTAARAKGAVIILVSPTPEWSDDLASAWQSVVLERVPAGQRNRWDRPLGLYVALVEEDRSRISKADGDRDLAKAVIDSRGALLVTHDIGLLTPTERAAADLTVSIPQLTADQLLLVSAAVGVRDLPPVGVTMPTTATPAALRLAGRPGQTAAEFIGRVGAFVAAIEGAKPGRREKQVVPGLDGLHGMDEAVAWGRGLAKDLRAYARGELAWSAVDRGCLLSGPPGTGKTTFAKRLASECGVPLVATSYSEWQSAGKEGHLGELMKCLRGKFAAARRQAPCILFIDELDSVQSRGGATKHDDWWTAIINGLLAEMDGMDGRDGVVIVAASNYADRVDSALRRAGRLDREIRISLPDIQALALILRGQIGDDLAGVDLSPAARLLLGGTGADCERAVRGAHRRARHAGRPVSLDDLVAEIGGGTDKRRPTRRTAIHEAAHAVVTAATRPADIIALSIRMSAGVLGGLLMRQPDSDGTEADIAAVMRELLAGRAAEEAILGQPSGGAGGSPDSDLARCTLLAVSAEATWGLGKSLAWLGDLSADDAARLVTMRPDIASRVEARLAAAYGDTLAMVRERRHLIEGLADALLEREVMTGDDVHATLASVSQMARKVRVAGERVAGTNDGVSPDQAAFGA